MCFSAPDMPQPKNDPPVSPPPPPPAPSATAQGLKVGTDRQSAPIKTFLSNALGARRRGSSLTIPMNSDSGSGLNIPQG